MDAFELAVSAVPSERKCIQRVGRFNNWPADSCFFGVPSNRLYGREPLETLPDSAGRFHFYLGSDALPLIDAFTKSKYAAGTTHLSVGDSCYSSDESELDYSALVESLSSGFFPALRSLDLGVWQLFSNSHCLYGRLGDVTPLFDRMPALEELGLYGCFDLTSPTALPALRQLQVALDDPVTSFNGGPLSQSTFENLLCSSMPNLAELSIDVRVYGSEAAYIFPESFLAGANVPKLTTAELVGRFAPGSREQMDRSVLARRTGLRLFITYLPDDLPVRHAIRAALDGR